MTWMDQTMWMAEELYETALEAVIPSSDLASVYPSTGWVWYPTWGISTKERT